MRFVDTNIALYAVSTYPEDERKQLIAETILTQESDSLAISIQVLGEFYVQATRPARPYSMGHEQALAVMERLKRLHVQPLTVETVDRALSYRQRYRLNYWDCLILAAAKQSECEAVLSEDMSANQDYDGIRVINPFAEENQPAQV